MSSYIAVKENTEEKGVNPSYLCRKVMEKISFYTKTICHCKTFSSQAQPVQQLFIIKKI